MMQTKKKVMTVGTVLATAAAVYVAAAMLFGREFTTVPGEAFVVGCVFAVFPFVPLFGLVLFVQWIWLWVSRRCGDRTRRLGCYVVPVIALCVIAVWTCKPPSAKERELGFSGFFSTKPPSVRVLQYGYGRSLSGGGSYVLVFEVSRNDLVEMMEQEGYKAVDINSDPGSWRLSLCNTIIAQLSRQKLEIDASFLCFAKINERSHARVFYDQQKGLAVFLGRGGYDVRTWGGK
jgi:hypothetical protein